MTRIHLKLTGCHISVNRPPSWLNEILGSTSPPTPYHLQTAAREVVDSKETLSLVDAEIGAVEDYIDLLKTARQKIKARIASHQSVLAPIRRLPPEILSNIFVATISDTKLCNPLDLQELPWLLGKVCRSWKKLSESTPKLWSRIRLELKFVSSFATQSHLSIQTFIHRAAKHALQLNVDFSYHESHPVIDTIVAYAPQWEDVSFTLMKPSTWKALSPIRSRLPMLRSLRLKLGYTWFLSDTSSPSQQHDLFRDAPSLRSLEINPYYQPLHVPWNQLRYITTYCSDPISAWYIFRDACNIVECDIAVQTNIHSVLPPSSLITLPSVRTLTLRQSYEVIQYLDLPVIHELRLMDISLVDESHTLKPIPSFSSLRILRFIEVFADEATFCHLLRMAPSVVELILDTSCVHSILEALVYQPRSPVPLQNLKRIIFQGHFPDYCHQLLMAVLESRSSANTPRSPSVTRLESIMFTKADLPAFDIQSRYASYLAQGVQIRFTE